MRRTTDITYEISIPKGQYMLHRRHRLHSVKAILAAWYMNSGLTFPFLLIISQRVIFTLATGEYVGSLPWDIYQWQASEQSAQ